MAIRISREAGRLKVSNMHFNTFPFVQSLRQSFGPVSGGQASKLFPPLPGVLGMVR